MSDEFRPPSLGRKISITMFREKKDLERKYWIRKFIVCGQRKTIRKVIGKIAVCRLVSVQLDDICLLLYGA